MLGTLKRHKYLIGAILVVLVVGAVLGAWRLRHRICPVYHVVIKLRNQVTLTPTS